MDFFFIFAAKLSAPLATPEEEEEEEDEEEEEEGDMVSIPSIAPLPPLVWDN